MFWLLWQHSGFHGNIYLRISLFTLLWSTICKIWCASFNDNHQQHIDVFVSHGWLCLRSAGIGECMYKTSDAFKAGKENAQLVTCYSNTCFGCYGNILVSMVTYILGYLFSPFCDQPYATPKPRWPLLGSGKVFWSPWQWLPWYLNPSIFPDIRVQRPTFMPNFVVIRP